MLLPVPAGIPLDRLAAQDVVWRSPSEDAAGSMPIGNGEVVLNVWVEGTTGDVLFYIARTDAVSEISRYLKLGRVRVHMEPSPFAHASDFSQHLHLHDGTIEITGGGAAVNLFVDANAHVIHVSGASKRPETVTAQLECWRNTPRTIPKNEQGSAWSVHDAPFPLVESADMFPNRGRPEILWCHRNETSIVPKLWENQSLSGLKGLYDTILHRTFGGVISGRGFIQDGPRSLRSAQPGRSFELFIATHSAQTPNLHEWETELDKVAKSSPRAQALKRTEAWWHGFWDRSWVFVEGDGAAPVTQGYILQRFVQACQGRGWSPIKFNGGFYTVEPKNAGHPFNADWRAWGDSHWLQNIRHMYAPMPAQGDFDMMDPFFRLYEKALPLAKARAKAYHNAEGAYFPETMTLYGTYSGGDYGWNRTGHTKADVLCPYWQFAWNQGPEIAGLMLDRWDYTQDRTFLKKQVLPMATAVLKYFDTRFKKDSSGRIVLDPTQSVETYWYGVVNDMPSTSGLISITQRLCGLPSKLLTSKQSAFYTRMKAACPELPMQTVGGQEELAPAQKYDTRTSNSENPALYGVWPFRLVSLAHPALLEKAKRAYAHRLNHNDVGWGYDGNVAALLGLTDEAARILKVKCANSHPNYRWPATWGPNYDWLPDQNHGGNLLETANLMLLQCEPLEAGGAIRVLPAWPKTWNVDFQLHAPGNTIVRCQTKGGRIVRLDVTPESRRKDVVLPGG